MIMTLKEIQEACRDWETFCRLHGYNEWAVNEGGEDVQVELTLEQARQLGILCEKDVWK